MQFSRSMGKLHFGEKIKMICWEFFKILHFLDFSLYHTIFIHIVIIIIIIIINLYSATLYCIVKYSGALYNKKVEDKRKKYTPDRPR